MQKLIIAPNSHVIIFWDGSQKFITQFENHKLEELITKGIEIFELKSGGKYKFKDIQKWLPMNEYYDLYPEKKPEKPNYVKLKEIKKAPFTKARHIKALKNLIMGFEKEFEGREIPKKSKKILNNMHYRLRLSEEDPSEERKNPIEEIINISF